MPTYNEIKTNMPAFKPFRGQMARISGINFRMNGKKVRFIADTNGKDLYQASNPTIRGRIINGQFSVYGGGLPIKSFTLKEAKQKLIEIADKINIKPCYLATSPKHASIRDKDNVTSLYMILHFYQKRKNNHEKDMSQAEALDYLKEKCFDIKRIKIDYSDLNIIKNKLIEIAGNIKINLIDLSVSHKYYAIKAKDNITNFYMILYFYQKEENNHEKDMSLSEALAYLKEKCFGIKRLNYSDLNAIKQILIEMADYAKVDPRDLSIMHKYYSIKAKDNATSLLMILYFYQKKINNHEKDMSQAEALAYLKEKCFGIKRVDYSDLNAIKQMLIEIADNTGKSSRALSIDHVHVKSKNNITSLYMILHFHQKQENNHEKDMSQAEALAYLKEKCFGIKRVDYSDLNAIKQMLIEMADYAGESLRDLSTYRTSFKSKDNITSLNMILRFYQKKENNHEKDMGLSEALAYLKEKCFGIKRIYVDYSDLNAIKQILIEMADYAEVDLRDLSIMRKYYSIKAKDNATSLPMILYFYQKKINNHEKDMSRAEALAYLKEKCFGIMRDKPATINDIDRLIKEKLGISDLAETFKDRPDLVIELMVLVLEDSVPTEELTRLINGYCLNLGEGMEGRNTGLKPRNREERKARRKERMRAAMDKLSQMKKFKDKEKIISHLVDIHQKLWYEEFNGKDFDAALKNLEKNILSTKDMSKVVLTRLKDRFIKIHEWQQPENIRASLFLHQKEGAMYLAENDRALLADEPGAGKTLQAMAAAEYLRARGEVKKAVIICQSSLKENVWKRQFSEHTKETPPVTVISGNRDNRNLQYREFAKKGVYLVVNYEELRDIGARPEDLDALTKGLDLVIVDEVQEIENSQAQQAKAVMEHFNPKRKWLLSATPYSNVPHKFFYLMQYLFPEKEEFKDENHTKWWEQYARDTKGLLLLNKELKEIMVRRKIDDIFGEYPAEADNNPARKINLGFLFPRKVEVPYETAGKYTLNDEQCGIIREMIFDFKSWANKYNDSHITGTQINVDKITPLEKLLYIFYAVLDPKLVGGKTESSLYAEIDKLVEEKMLKGEKVLIFTEHTYFIDKLLERYKKYGVTRFDGKTKKWLDKQDRIMPSNQSAQALMRDVFQGSPNSRIMIANIKSGGAGVSFTAADNVIFVEKPYTHTKYFQASDRPHRIDYKRKKTKVNIYTMVGKYPESFVNSLPESEKPYFDGSPREKLEKILNGKKDIYRLVMDGILSEKQLNESIKRSLTEAIFHAAKPSKREKEERTAEILEPLDKRINDPSEKNILASLGVNYIENDELLKDLVDAAVKWNIPVKDLEIINSHFEQKHRHLKLLLVAQVADLLAKFKQQGIEFGKDDLEKHKVPTNSYLTALFATKGSPYLLGLLDEIYSSANSLDAESQKKVKDRLFLGMALLNGNFASVLSGNPGIAKQDPLRASDAFYHIGVLKEAANWLPPESNNDINSLMKAIEEAYINNFNRVMELEVSRSEVEDLYKKWGSFNQLFALMSGYKKASLTEEAGKLSELVNKILKSEYKAWRNNGSVTSYLKENLPFWEKWTQNNYKIYENAHLVRAPKEEVTKAVENIKHKMEKMEKMRIVEYFIPGWLKNKWEEYLGYKNKGPFFADISNDVSALNGIKGRLKSNNQLTEKENSDYYRIIKAYGYPENKEIGMFDNAGKLFSLLNNLGCFARLHEKLSSIDLTDKWIKETRKTISDAMAVIDYELTAPLNTRVVDQRKIKAELKDLQILLNEYGKVISFKELKISDTDDPKRILESGGIAPDMANCMHYHGDPNQNRCLVDTLGSKNKKLIIIEGDGMTRAAATVKIRKDKEGKPILFLEKPLHRFGYSFVEEMVKYLLGKAKALGPDTKVAIQVSDKNDIRHPDKYKFTETSVAGTGNYATEYIEPLFHIGTSKNISHEALIVESK